MKYKLSYTMLKYFNVDEYKLYKPNLKFKTDKQYYNYYLTNGYKNNDLPSKKFLIKFCPNFDYIQYNKFINKNLTETLSIIHFWKNNENNFISNNITHNLSNLCTQYKQTILIVINDMLDVNYIKFHNQSITIFLLIGYEIFCIINDTLTSIRLISNKLSSIFNNNTTFEKIIFFDNSIEKYTPDEIDVFKSLKIPTLIYNFKSNTINTLNNSTYKIYFNNYFLTDKCFASSNTIALNGYFPSSIIKYINHKKYKTVHIDELNFNEIIEKFQPSHILHSNSKNINLKIMSTVSGINNINFWDIPKFKKTQIYTTRLENYNLFDISGSKNIFLIISKIKIPNESIEERFKQIKKTINSIKKYVPDAMICLIDNSNFFDCIHIHEYLYKNINIFMNINNEHIHKYVNIQPYNFLSETILIYNAINYIKCLGLKFKNLFKINHSCYLNESFDISLYDNDFNIFKINDNNLKNKYHRSCFYKIDCIQFDNYISANTEILNNEQKYIEVKHHKLSYLLTKLLEFKLVQNLGVTTYIFKTGNLEKI